MSQNLLKIKESIRKLFSRVGSDPIKDWNVLLAVISVLFILSLTYQITLFFSAYEEQPETVGSSGSSIKNIDSKNLSEVIKNLDYKNKEYKDFISNPPAFREPSF